MHRRGGVAVVAQVWLGLQAINRLKEESALSKTGPNGQIKKLYFIILALSSTPCEIFQPSGLIKYTPRTYLETKI